MDGVLGFKNFVRDLKPIFDSQIKNNSIIVTNLNSLKNYFE